MTNRLPTASMVKILRSGSYRTIPMGTRREIADQLEELLAREAREEGRREGWAAVEADYERRIRAALSLPLDPTGSARVWPDGGLGCFDCGRRYGDAHGFPDLVVPPDAWARISPTGHEGGLLCPSCLCARAHLAGVECRAVFRSGPFFADHAALSREAREDGRREGLREAEAIARRPASASNRQARIIADAIAALSPTPAESAPGDTGAVPTRGNEQEQP